MKHRSNVHTSSYGPSSNGDSTSTSSGNYVSANSHLSCEINRGHTPSRTLSQDARSSLFLPTIERSEVHLENGRYPFSPSYSPSLDPSLRSSNNSPSKSIFSNDASIPKQLPQYVAKGVVSNTSFLTKEILDIGNEALAIYDKIRLVEVPERSQDSHVMQQTLSAYDCILQQKLRSGFQEPHVVQQTPSAEGSQEPHVIRQTLSAYVAIPRDLPESSQEPRDSEFNDLQHHPFWNFEPKDLEQYFSAAIDVKNALHMRRSMVTIDIGNALESLLPKLNLYERDKATIITAEEEIELIKEVCLKKSFGLNFYALEYMRSMLPSRNLSVLEKYGSLLASTERILDDKDCTYTAAERFLEDPSTLKENRLPFNTSQR